MEKWKRSTKYIEGAQRVACLWEWAQLWVLYSSILWFPHITAYDGSTFRELTALERGFYAMQMPVWCYHTIEKGFRLFFLNIFEPYLLLREDKTGLGWQVYESCFLKYVKSACLTTSVRLGFYMMRKDVPLNPASLRTGLIETEEVVVYKGAWPRILRYTDSGAL